MKATAFNPPADVVQVILALPVQQTTPQTRVLQISVMYKRTEFHSWALPRKAVHSGNLS